jgi:hypothetical protein
MMRDALNKAALLKLRSNSDPRCRTIDGASFEG